MELTQLVMFEFNQSIIHSGFSTCTEKNLSFNKQVKLCSCSLVGCSGQYVNENNNNVKN